MDGKRRTSRRLNVVKLLDDLRETGLDELVSGQPRVVLVVQVLPLDLVLEGLHRTHKKRKVATSSVNDDSECTDPIRGGLWADLLQLLTAHKHLDLPLLSGLAGDRDLHLRLVLVGKDSGGLLEDLSVVSVLETPLAGERTVVIEHQ
jgi:hypothetical protein